MTGTAPTDSIPPAAFRRPLMRSRDDKIVFGVAAAIGRYTDTDPVIWRVAFVVLTVFGGAGALAYLLGWVLIREQETGESIVERLLRRHTRPFAPGSVLTIVVLGVIALVVVQQRQDSLVAVIVVGALAYGVLHRRGRHHSTFLPSAGAGELGPGSASSTAQPHAASPGATVGARVSRRPRCALGWVTASASAIVAGVLLALRLAGVHGLSAPRVIAAALLVVGVGLVVGTWYGRSRGLILLGAVLTLAVPPAAVASDAIRFGTGNRSWAPIAVDASAPLTYRLGVGEATLDLSAVPGSAGAAAITAHVKFGHLIVVVPADRSVHLKMHVGLGDIRLFGADQGGSRLDRDVLVGTSAGPPLELTLGVGIGQVEVNHG